MMATLKTGRKVSAKRQARRALLNAKTRAAAHQDPAGNDLWEAKYGTAASLLGALTRVENHLTAGDTDAALATIARARATAGHNKARDRPFQEGTAARAATLERGIDTALSWLDGTHEKLAQ